MANLAQKFKVVSFKAKIWYQIQFEYAKFDSDVEFFHFKLEIFFLGKFALEKSKLFI